MYDFECSLLREKFQIYDAPPAKAKDDNIMIALSNRVQVKLVSPNGNAETFIIRTQNMHTCVRTAALIVADFQKFGPILSRAKDFEWEDVWVKVVNEYEHRFNKDRWVAIYNKGRPIYTQGSHYPLLDIIEKCDALNDEDYDKSVALAENAFEKAGRAVKIKHDSNVALVVNIEKYEARVGLILRGPNKTTTFNFAVAGKKGKPIDISACLMTASSFLEGVQLCFTIGMGNEKINYGISKPGSDDEKKNRSAIKRLGTLRTQVINFENAYEVRYRPEKPNFPGLITEAEKFAQKVLVPPEDSGFIV